MKLNNNKYKEIEDKYKQEVEKDGDYEYIRIYRKGDILSNGKLVTKNSYIKVKHKYCDNIYDVQSTCFINIGQRCPNCCKNYENSFAYHIEVELGESLDKYWDFDKNTLNPYHIYKNSKQKVWVGCTNEDVNEINGLMKKDYHGSYELSCSDFTNGKRCSYCNPSGKNPKVHLYDSFGYKHFDKVCMNWHPDNEVSPFKVSKCSGKKYKFICDKCGHVWKPRLESINRGCWCINCSCSKGEDRITKYLIGNSITYEIQKKYKGLLGLGRGLLSYDFYLPDYNLLIEYQGKQHDGNSDRQSKEDFNKQVEHDIRKWNYARDNKINLLEIWYWNYNKIEEILDCYLEKR